MKNASDILLIASVLVVVGVVIFSIVRRNKVKKNGIEADAVVTREYVDRVVGEGCGRADHVVYVNYRSREGQIVEARLDNPSRKMTQGMQIRVKYMPDKPKYVVWVK